MKYFNHLNLSRFKCVACVDRCGPLPFRHSWRTNVSRNEARQRELSSNLQTQKNPQKKHAKTQPAAELESKRRQHTDKTPSCCCQMKAAPSKIGNFSRFKNFIFQESRTSSATRQLADAFIQIARLSCLHQRELHL